MDTACLRMSDENTRFTLECRVQCSRIGRQVRCSLCSGIGATRRAERAYTRKSRKSGGELEAPHAQMHKCSRGVPWVSKGGKKEKEKREEGELKRRREEEEEDERGGAHWYEVSGRVAAGLAQGAAQPSALQRRCERP